MSVFDDFKTHGINASFHYADDTASGEWRLARKEKLKALKLFDDNPDLQDEMRVIAKGFLWSLASDRPILYADNPEYAEERRLNEYATESRKLPNGCTKESGVVLEPTIRDQNELAPDLPSNNGRY